MTTQEELTERLLCSAQAAWRQSARWGLWQERLRRMDELCQGELTRDHYDYVNSCFALLLQAQAEEKAYLYRQGLLDGVTMLKDLGVLL